jgi:DNA-binding IclR family transcriptional regulator
MTPYPVKAVGVSHEVVEVLAEREDAGVTEVATALDVPKSTAHDHLRTLEQVGSVVNESGTYRLSMQFLRMGEVARNNHELFIWGRDEALGLSETTGEQKYVQLVTEENGRCAVLLATGWQRENLPPQATHAYPTHAHLHTNAPGKAILANMDTETVERILGEHGLPRRTPDTITDETELFAELEHVREQGYATDDGELITGMTGVGTPIVTDTTVHGAIAVYSASEGFETDLHGSQFVDMVRESADEIRANLIFARD